MQQLVQRGAAQIGIHHQHALVGLRKHRGQVQGRGGFTFAGTGADDHDAGEFFIFARKQDVGAQDAVSFGVTAFRAFINQVADVLRDDAQHGCLEGAFHVINGLDAGVEILDEERQAHADNEAENQTQGDVQRFVGPHRGFAGFGNHGLFRRRSFGQVPVNLFHFNLVAEQLVSFLLVGQIAFFLPVRLAPDGFILVFFGGQFHFVDKRVERRFLRVQFIFHPDHDAVNAVINLVVHLIDHGLNADDIRVRQGQIVGLGDKLLLGFMEFVEQAGQRAIGIDGRQNVS